MTAALLFAAPLLVVLLLCIAAWRERRLAGGPDDFYTLENCWYFVYGSTRHFDQINWVHISAFWQTIVVSVVITIANFPICYPLAYNMAQVAQPSRLRVLLLLLIVPYWVNEILRAFAFLVLFGTGGTINKILLGLGLIAAPIDFIGQNVALYAGLTYAHLLPMIFPLYNGIFLATLGQSTFISAYCMLIFMSRLQRFDRAQEEAALDLGASRTQVFFHILLPFLKPALLSAAVLAFLSSFENDNTTTFAILADKTLTTALAGRVRQGTTPAISALAVLIIAVTLAGAVIYEILRRREQARDEARAQAAAAAERSDEQRGDLQPGSAGA